MDWKRWFDEGAILMLMFLVVALVCAIILTSGSEVSERRDKCEASGGVLINYTFHRSTRYVCLKKEYIMEIE